MAAECGEALAVRAPLRCVDEARTLRERGVELALDAVLHFSVHQDRCTVVREELQVCRGALDLLLDRRLRKPSGIPARYAGQAVLAEFGLQRCRLAGKFVAE